MAIEVKKISDLPEATSVTGDELLEMAFNGMNYKVRARKLVEGRNISIDDIAGLSEVLTNKVDKVPGKQLSDQNFTQAEKNKLSNLNYMLDDKVDREWGKGLIEPAPRNGKQYARKNDAWVEIESGLKTQLVGTTLYMSDDGSNPVPVEPTYSTFSYEFEVGGYTDLGGTFAHYGVSEASLTPIGTFINNIENENIGKVRAISWMYDQNDGYSLGVMAENSDYLHTYSKNLEVAIRDQSGEILRLTVTPENIHNPAEGLPPLEGGTPPPIVTFQVSLTEEQFNLLPKEGVVFVDITIETSGEVNKPDVEIFKYEFEVGQDIEPEGKYEYYGVNENYSIGAFINKIENDKIGNLVALEWGNDQEHGYSISGVSKYSGYLLSYNRNLVLNIRDQNGDILSITIPPEEIFEMGTGDVTFGVDLTEEQFNLLPKEGIVFVDIVLETVPNDNLFRYEFEVEASPYNTYGVSETDFIDPFGTFINNNENEKIGELVAVEWGAVEIGYRLSVASAGSDYLLSYNNNLGLIVSDQSGEILRVTVTPDNVFEITVPEISDLQPPFALMEVFLTGEQYSLLPKSGIVFLDIDLDPTPDLENDYSYFNYEFEVGQETGIDSDGDEFAYYGVSESDIFGPFGTFVENTENDKLGKVTSVVWTSDYNGHDIYIITENSDYLFYNETSISITVIDQDGGTVSAYLEPWDVEEGPNGEVIIKTYLDEEDFDLLPKSGIVFVGIDLKPYVGGPAV